MLLSSFCLLTHVAGWCSTGGGGGWQQQWRRVGQLVVKLIGHSWRLTWQRMSLHDVQMRCNTFHARALHATNRVSCIACPNTDSQLCSHSKSCLTASRPRAPHHQPPPITIRRVAMMQCLNNTSPHNHIFCMVLTSSLCFPATANHNNNTATMGADKVLPGHSTQHSATCLCPRQVFVPPLLVEKAIPWWLVDE